TKASPRASPTRSAAVGAEVALGLGDRIREPRSLDEQGDHDEGVDAAEQQPDRAARGQLDERDDGHDVDGYEPRPTVANQESEQERRDRDDDRDQRQRPGVASLLAEDA